jgi:DNA repair protein RadC
MREDGPTFVKTARDAADLLAPLLDGMAEERVAVLHLGPGRELLHIAQAEVGGTTRVGLPIRAVVEEAIRLGADGIVVAHNHPSGDASPSEVDIGSTRRLAAVTAELGITLHDHLIFGAGQVTSFRLLRLL